MAPAPVELLDGADRPSLPLFCRISACRGPGQRSVDAPRDDQAEVGAHELVLRPRGSVHAPDEAAAGAVVATTCACFLGEAREKRSFETRVCQLRGSRHRGGGDDALASSRPRRAWRGWQSRWPRDRAAWPAAPRSGRLPDCSSAFRRRSDGAARLTRRSAARARNGRKSCGRRAEERMKRVALASFNATRKFYFFLVSEDPPSGRPNRQGRREVAVVRHDRRCGERGPSPKFRVEILAQGEGCAGGVVHGLLVLPMPLRGLGSLGTVGNNTRDRRTPPGALTLSTRRGFAMPDISSSSGRKGARNVPGMGTMRQAYRSPWRSPRPSSV